MSGHRTIVLSSRKQQAIEVLLKEGKADLANALAREVTATGSIEFVPGKLYFVDRDEMVFIGGGTVRVKYDPRQQNLPGFEGPHKGKFDETKAVDFVFIDKHGDSQKFTHEQMEELLAGNDVEPMKTCKDWSYWLDEDAINEFTIQSESSGMFDTNESSGEDDQIFVPYWMEDMKWLEDLEGYLVDSTGCFYTKWHVDAGPTYSRMHGKGDIELGQGGDPDYEHEIQLEGGDDWVVALIKHPKLKGFLKNKGLNPDWLPKLIYNRASATIIWTAKSAALKKALLKTFEEDPRKFKNLQSDAEKWKITDDKYRDFGDVIRDLFQSKGDEAEASTEVKASFFASALAGAPNRQEVEELVKLYADKLQKDQKGVPLKLRDQAYVAFQRFLDKMAAKYKDMDLESGIFWKELEKRAANLMKTQPEKLAACVVRAAEELPMPEGVKETAWSGAVPAIQQSLQSLKSAGVQYKIDPKGPFYDYVVCTYKGRKFGIDVQNLTNPKAIKSVVQMLPALISLAEELEGWGRKEFFYDTLQDNLKKLSGQKEGRHLAFTILVKMLEGKGIKVHSSVVRASPTTYQVSFTDKKLQFKSEKELVDALKKLGIEKTGTESRTSIRKELQGQPKFNGLYGPMYNGPGVVRYESREVYRQLSMGKKLAASIKTKRDIIATLLDAKRPDLVNLVVKAQGPFPALQNEAAARKKASADIHKLITNKYFDGIPVNEISDILEKHGFSAQELEGIYTGREGRTHDQVGPKTWIVLSWYKMPESGRYEITCYLS